MNDQSDNESASIAVIGASARAAAQSIQRAGLRVIAADLFADADLLATCSVDQISNYPEGFRDWLPQQQVDCWLYAGALENYPDLVDGLAMVAPLWGNTGSVLCGVRDPLRLQQVLRKAGLNFPETRAMPSQNEDWLAKTYRGSSGSGVMRWAPNVHDSQSYYYQRPIQGTPISATFVASQGEAELLGITKQLIDVAWTRSKPFQYAGSLGPWPTSLNAETAIIRTGNLLAEVLGLVGLFGVDMILDDNEVWTIEVNPRYTAAVEVVERVTGRSAIKAHVEAFLPEPNALATEAQTRNAFHNSARYAGKAILFASESTTATEQFTAWALAQKRKQ